MRLNCRAWMWASLAGKETTKHRIDALGVVGEGYLMQEGWEKVDRQIQGANGRGPVSTGVRRQVGKVASAATAGFGIGKRQLGGQALERERREEDVIGGGGCMFPGAKRGSWGGIAMAFAQGTVVAGGGEVRSVRSASARLLCIAVYSPKAWRLARAGIARRASHLRCCGRCGRAGAQLSHQLPHQLPQTLYFTARPSTPTPVHCSLAMSSPRERSPQPSPKTTQQARYPLHVQTMPEAAVPAGGRVAASA